MGNFYVNVCVRNYPQAKLVDAFSSLSDRAYIGPDTGDWCCIVTEFLDTQDQRVIDVLGSALSRERCAISALNHDDDVLSADLYVNGERVGEYNSCPGMFKENPSPDDLRPRLTNPQSYADAAGRSVAEINEMMVDSLGEYTPAITLHQRLIQLFGLPPYTLGAGFRYVMESEATLNGVAWTPSGSGWT